MTALAHPSTSTRVRLLKDRVADIENEIRGVKAQYNITQFELNVMETLKGQSWGSPKQRQILNEIERKVFGYSREDFDVK